MLKIKRKSVDIFHVFCKQHGLATSLRLQGKNPRKMYFKNVRIMFNVGSVGRHYLPIYRPTFDRYVDRVLIEIRPTLGRYIDRVELSVGRYVGHHSIETLPLLPVEILLVSADISTECRPILPIVIILVSMKEIAVFALQ